MLLVLLYLNCRMRIRQQVASWGSFQTDYIPMLSDGMLEGANPSFFSFYSEHRMRNIICRWINNFCRCAARHPRLYIAHSRAAGQSIKGKISLNKDSFVAPFKASRRAPWLNIWPWCVFAEICKRKKVVSLEFPCAGISPLSTLQRKSQTDWKITLKVWEFAIVVLKLHWRAVCAHRLSLFASRIQVFCLSSEKAVSSSRCCEILMSKIASSEWAGHRINALLIDVLLSKRRSFSPFRGPLIFPN